MNKEKAGTIEISDRTEVVFVLPSGERIAVKIRRGELQIETEAGQPCVAPARGTNAVTIFVRAEEG